MNKIQTCFLFALIAGLSTLALSTKKMRRPESPSVDVASSFELGTTYGEFRVLYPGVSEPENSDRSKDAKIKLFKDGVSKLLIDYTVPGDRKADSDAFYFALKDATPGKYQAQVCHGTKCSGKVRSYTNIPELKDRKEVTCIRLKEEEVEGTKTNTTVGEFHLEVIPVTTMATMAVVKGTPDSDYKKAGLDGFVENNPGYGNGYLVAAPMYNMTHYKQMFDIKTLDDQQQPKEFTEEYCSRKYILTANTHLVDRKTKEVKYRFKTTLNPDQNIIDKYILEGTSSVPVIQAYKADIKPGNYIVWMAFCTSYKDLIESTVCSEAYEQQLWINPNLLEKIAVIGGYEGNGHNIAQVKCYNFTDESWDIACLPDMPVHRYGHGVVQINTELYVIGGVDDRMTNSTYFLDLETKREWSSGFEMGTPRAHHGTAVLNGLIYAVGGFDENHFNGLNVGEVFNPTKKLWSSIAPMSRGRHHFSLIPVGNKLYAIGGAVVPLNIIECYDTAKNSWSIITSSPQKTARMAPAVAIFEGKIYVAGGYIDGTETTKFEMYDPVKNEWESLADMTTARAYATMVVFDGKLYILRGDGVKTGEIYDPVINSWAPFPTDFETTNHGAASLVIKAVF